MKVLPKILAVGVVACMATTAFAADHRDGPSVTDATDKSVDINDVFAFTEGDNVNLGMDVFPFAETTSHFSDATEYVFHVTSSTAFGANDGTATNVICTFDAAQTIQCWIGDTDYVTGDASSDTTPLAAADGKFSVFAGRRADPFYFYLTDGATPPGGGFNGARAAALAAIPTLTASNFYASGCIHAADVFTLVTSKAVATQQSQNNFAPANVLAISMQIDKGLLTDATHPFFSVWASTNVAP